MDRAALSRVVGNLVDNAVRAAGPGGSVHLAVHPTGTDGAVAIDVVDDGRASRWPDRVRGPRPGAGQPVAGGLRRAAGARQIAPHGTRARVVLPGRRLTRRCSPPDDQADVVLCDDHPVFVDALGVVLAQRLPGRAIAHRTADIVDLVAGTGRRSAWSTATSPTATA